MRPRNLLWSVPAVFLVHDLEWVVTVESWVRDNAAPLLVVRRP